MRTLSQCEVMFLKTPQHVRYDPRGKCAISEMELAIECAVLARNDSITHNNGNFNPSLYFQHRLGIGIPAARAMVAEIHRRGLFAMAPEEARALIVATAQARLGKMLKIAVSATGKPIRDPRKPLDDPDPWLYEYDDTAATRWARELAKQTGSDAPVKSEVTIVSVADELKRRIARLERGNADAVVVAIDADQAVREGDSSGSDDKPSWWCEGLE